MRVLFLFLSIATLVAIYSFASWTGLLVAAAACFALAAGCFFWSNAAEEARESKELMRRMGRSTTFLSKLGKR